MQLTNRQLFLKNIAQTTHAPIMIEIERAKGVYMYDNKGKKYLDLISGVSVSNLGHCHQKIIKAIDNQLHKYSHLMVYGEFIQSPQVKFAELLTSILPEKLNNVYFVNSGSEAIEGAMKLAKRYTGRTQIISMKNAYHGSSQGALSILGDEYYKAAYRPLLPDVNFIEFNNLTQLDNITEKTACVFVEPIQGEAGIILPENNYLSELRKKCDKHGVLLIFDEVQTAFGRTGKMFALEKYNIIPDIIILAKALGGGMPLGAFIANKKIMNVLQIKPILGHITTFGGHPISCAAGLACLETIIAEKLVNEVDRKGKLFVENLKHHKIKQIRGCGLFYAIDLGENNILMKFMAKITEIGMISDWFLFNDTSFRISPPIIISDDEVAHAVDIILKALNEI